MTEEVPKALPGGAIDIIEINIRGSNNLFVRLVKNVNARRFFQSTVRRLCRKLLQIYTSALLLC
jgi:hypothetical protein